jgi:uncharacterized protein YecE (DUF72 family)
MDAFVGTSGWAYAWNLNKSLDWFVQNSNLNAIELNMSFYRFPTAKAVQSWVTKGAGLRWSIKANRIFTHNYKFSLVSKEKWGNFRRVFAPLDGKVDFYLFQLPPDATPDWADWVADFAEFTGLRERFALEFRNKAWFTPEWARWAEKLGITLVSVDAPRLPQDVFGNAGSVYFRVHGRLWWYHHNYSQSELEAIADKIKVAKPEKAYVFFNNDHNMLTNAQTMQRILKQQTISVPT